jgi:hypothetical protein
MASVFGSSAVDHPARQEMQAFNIKSILSLENLGQHHAAQRLAVARQPLFVSGDQRQVRNSARIGWVYFSCRLAPAQNRYAKQNDAQGQEEEDDTSLPM